MENNYSHIKTQVDAVVHFFEQLDLDMIELLLDEHQFSGYDKKQFILVLGDVFNRYCSQGDYHLYICHDSSVLGKTAGNGDRTIIFRGNKSGIELHIKLKYKNWRIINISDTEIDNSNNYTKRIRIRKLLL
jgi:hypothetical protein